MNLRGPWCEQVSHSRGKPAPRCAVQGNGVLWGTCWSQGTFVSPSCTSGAPLGLLCQYYLCIPKQGTTVSLILCSKRQKGAKLPGRHIW